MAGGSSNPHHKVDTAPRSGLVWGIDRGHKTTRRVPAARASRRKGKLSQRSAVVNSVVREVAGFAPYERRAMELIRNSKVSRRGRTRRLCWVGACQGIVSKWERQRTTRKTDEEMLGVRDGS